MKILSGYKTYLCAAGAGIAVAAHALGWIDQGTLEAALVLLGFGGLAALRAGVAKK